MPNTMNSYKATSANKRDIPQRFWYLQMLEKRFESLLQIVRQLDSEKGVNVSAQYQDLLMARVALRDAVMARFEDPRVAQPVTE